MYITTESTSKEKTKGTFFPGQSPCLLAALTSRLQRVYAIIIEVIVHCVDASTQKAAIHFGRTLSKILEMRGTNRYPVYPVTRPGLFVGLNIKKERGLTDSAKEQSERENDSKSVTLAYNKTTPDLFVFGLPSTQGSTGLLTSNPFPIRACVTNTVSGSAFQ